MLNLHKRAGFTLVEILIVIATMSILAAIVIIAINPARQIAQANNAQRRSDVNTILNAVSQYSVDNSGNLLSTITTIATEICRTGGVCTGLIDLSVLTASELYLISLPTDPQATNPNGTGYQIRKTANNRVVVSAPNAQLGTTVSVSR